MLYKIIDLASGILVMLYFFRFTLHNSGCQKSWGIFQAGDFFLGFKWKNFFISAIPKQKIPFIIFFSNQTAAWNLSQKRHVYPQIKTQHRKAGDKRSEPRMTATFATGNIAALRALVSCHHKLTNSFTWDRCLKATHGGCSWVIRRISLCMETTALKVYKVFQQKTMDTQLRICDLLFFMAYDRMCNFCAT